MKATKTAIKAITILTENQLVDMLLSRKGATFVRLDSCTIPNLLKKGNPFWNKENKTMNVSKDSSTNAMIGVNYANLVNNARNKEAIKEVIESLMSALGMLKKDAEAYLDSLLSNASEMVNINAEAFEPKERKWGKHMVDENGLVSKTMVEHTNKAGVYSQYIQIMVINSTTPVYRYTDTGEVLTEQDLATLKSFIPKRNSNADHQGLKKEIIIRDYKVENVRTLRLNKTEFVVKESAVVKVDTVSPVSA